MSPHPLLRVEGLCHAFAVSGGGLLRGRTVPVLHDVSFELASGEAYGLVGESGAGKTTLARAVLRLIEPTAGRIWLDGVELTALDRRELRSMRRFAQIVFQDPNASLPPRRTAGSILREPLDLYRIGDARQRDRRVCELLELVGLDPQTRGRYPHELSGGQRQRVAIARALAVEPRLLVADEPVTALDVSVQSQILNLLGDLRRRFEIGLVLISHDLAVVQQVCDRVGVMYLGRLVEQAPVDALFERPLHPYTQALLEAHPEPDPARRLRAVPLRGEPPSPLAVPPGCPFHPRCPKAFAPCDRVEPGMGPPVGATPDRLVSCHLHSTERNTK